MAEIDYDPPTWVDGSSQAIDAHQLNHISTALHQVVDLAARTAAGKALDADTVSGYGIGVNKKLDDSFNLAVTTIANGIYYVQSPYSGGSLIDTVGNYTVLVMNAPAIGTQAASIAQILLRAGNNAIIVHQYESDRGTWLIHKVWSSGSDGNGGQSPSAKENRTSDTTIGWVDSVDCASGAAVTLPAGGTFETEVTTYGATYNGVKCAIVAGGAMSGTAIANLTMRYKRLS